MTDIDRRMKHADQLPSRDLWPTIQLGPKPADVPARRRVLTIVVALGIGVGAVVVAVFALTPGGIRDEDRQGPATGGVDRGTPDSTPSAREAHDDGRITYSVTRFSQSAGTTVELHSIRPDGSGDRVIPTPPGLPRAHAWSPEGSRIALTIFPVGPGDRAIWVMDADGSNAHQVAAARFVSAPSWSPDGTRLAYSSRKGSSAEIHVVSADGGQDGVIYSEDATGTFDIFSVQWSPDGQRILFDRGTDSDFDIFVMEVDGSNVHPLTSTGTDYDPQWSPDGSEVAFTREEIIRG